MKIPRPIIAIVVISLIALVVSSMAEYEHVKSRSSLQAFCSIIARNSCESVQDSVYGKILGFDTAIYGIIGFGILFVVSLIYVYSKNIYSEYLMIAGTIIGGIMSLRFLYLQAFVLHQFCIFCLIVDSLGVLLLGLGLYLFKRKEVFG